MTGIDASKLYEDRAKREYEKSGKDWDKASEADKSAAVHRVRADPKTELDQYKEEHPNRQPWPYED